MRSASVRISGSEEAGWAGRDCTDLRDALAVQAGVGAAVVAGSQAAESERPRARETKTFRSGAH